MASAGPAADTRSEAIALGTAAEVLNQGADEREPGDRAPRTPSPWDADGDVHPVLDRFKRVRSAAALGHALCVRRLLASST